MVWNDCPRLNTGDVASRVLVLQGGSMILCDFAHQTVQGWLVLLASSASAGATSEFCRCSHIDWIAYLKRAIQQRWGIGFAYGEKPNLLLRTVLVLRAGGGGGGR